MREVLVTAGTRTPIGDINGSLASLGAVALGEISAGESLKRSGVPADKVDEVIIGNVLQAGLGQNPARQIAMRCGVPKEVPSFTVNQVCGSGLKALDLAAVMVACERIELAMAGGIESMSGAPYILPAMRSGARLGESPALDTVVTDGLTDVFGACHMGLTAENIAEKYAISRRDQDLFAAESQAKYASAATAGSLSPEIVPVTVRRKKSRELVDRDEHPRPGTTAETLEKLRPAFKKDGTVTAGNASGINDGAATLLVLSSGRAESLEIPRKDCLRIRDFSACGCAPELMGLGPIPAIQSLLEKQNLSVTDIDLWEINEAFAAQSIAVLNELKLDQGKVNIHGGAIALGHPIGASGARIVVTLMHAMKQRNAALGVASLCVGGGMGLAILLENL